MVLTDAGEKARLSARGLWKAAQERFDARVGADKAKQLRAALHAIARTDLGSAG